MGYACPVCAAPQADGEHLANHLAFSALLHHDDHEDWLDEHVPTWGASDPLDLAERVIEYAEEEEYPAVFEDTTESTDAERVPGHGHHEHSHTEHDHSSGEPAPGELTPEAQEILAEARELTEKRRRSGAETGDEHADADSDES